MNVRRRIGWAAGISWCWLWLAAGSALAHNGEDHPHGGFLDTAWLSVAGVLLVGVLVYRLGSRARLDADPDTAGPLDEDGFQTVTPESARHREP